ncbi:MAG: hypothetical protein IJJ51_02835 [Kiritimatiellae bacterium]|nr:hypothetical protein [Kiritimatiellia bacterium]
MAGGQPCLWKTRHEPGKTAQATGKRRQTRKNWGTSRFIGRCKQAQNSVYCLRRKLEVFLSQEADAPKASRLQIGVAPGKRKGSREAEWILRNGTSENKTTCRDAEAAEGKSGAEAAAKEGCRFQEGWNGEMEIERRVRRHGEERKRWLAGGYFKECGKNP